jgi:hypothetical protein
MLIYQRVSAFICGHFFLSHFDNIIRNDPILFSVHFQKMTARSGLSAMPRLPQQATTSSAWERLKAVWSSSSCRQAVRHLREHTTQNDETNWLEKYGQMTSKRDIDSDKSSPVMFNDSITHRIHGAGIFLLT